ncbi:hypothetical protein [Cupriavidus oxalaticus]|uniref:hypothetical protein n=1 Tax=Cupriavidus oxalaticus TaxID=96344 RepID=UPI003175E1A4
MNQFDQQGRACTGEGKAAWNLANLYLYSVGVPALSRQACHIEGLSQETTCYVSMSYFDETDPFADFVVLLPPDDQVDHGEYLAILAEAIRARNGWQRILKRCAPDQRRQPHVTNIRNTP